MPQRYDEGGVPKKMKGKKWIRPALFTLGEALAGLAYYLLIGCSTGSCAITSNPVRAMAYMGLIGWLLSSAFSTEGRRDE